MDGEEEIREQTLTNKEAWFVIVHDSATLSFQREWLFVSPN